jgi:hypothetical protein
MLVGFRDSRFEVGSIDKWQYFLRVTILWRTGIYGPADHSYSREFFSKITNIINRTVEPLIMGGDFHLIWSEEDKNNDRVNCTRINMFNEAINDWAVREIHLD